MSRKYLVVILLFLYPVFNMYAQNILFPDDENERGYFNHAYLRYEAEPEKCETNGIFLAPTFDQRELQSEASNQMAIQLIAKDTYVQWTNEKAADGLTIRFSLPDDAEGKGTRGNLVLYVNGDSIQMIPLNSYWAWQYILKSGSKYPDNTPNTSTKFPRMRFDEMHLKLAGKIPAKATFRLVKADDNVIPYTIDFVELEEVPEATTFESIEDENKIAYSPDDINLTSFIAQNKGKTIFIPEGRYEVDNRIYITADHTKIIGAGMWYTEIYFTASSDDKGTYSKRGIEASNSNLVLEGLFLNTINNKRYYNNDNRYQVGKGIMGSFGSNSVIRNVWIEHFECGGWIEGANNLNIQHCRFRNNYADGINLAYGCINSTLEQCSFRNNGDDDIASWSRGDRMCVGNVFRYLTSENNWRASGLGFFGGKQNKAYNIVITDPMEAGFRVTCDFPGMPFSNEGYSEFYNISVYRGGVASGVAGTGGDLWGNQQGALHINSSSQYDLQNIKIYDIDFYDSKNDAIFIGSTSKYIRNLVLRDIHVNGTGRYGLYFYNAKGNGSYCNLQYENIGANSNTNAVPASFIFAENCSTTSIKKKENKEIGISSKNNTLQITRTGNTSVSVYDIWGRAYSPSSIGNEQMLFQNLSSGIYLVKWNLIQHKKVLVR
ncbi:MAG: right-handed parallel beta-helix repeat-containing protein [Prolixibacteraceae bacterium]